MKDPDFLFKHLKAASHFQGKLPGKAKGYSYGQELPWLSPKLAQLQQASHYYVYFKDYTSNRYIAELVLNHRGELITKHDQLSYHLFQHLIKNPDLVTSITTNIYATNYLFISKINYKQQLSWEAIKTLFRHLEQLATQPLNFANSIDIVKYYQRPSEPLRHYLNSPFFLDIAQIIQQKNYSFPLAQYGSKSKRFIEQAYPLPCYWADQSKLKAPISNQADCPDTHHPCPQSRLEYLQISDLDEKIHQIKQIVAHQFIQENNSFIAQYAGQLPDGKSLRSHFEALPKGIVLASKKNERIQLYHKQLCTLTIQDPAGSTVDYLREGVNGFRSELHWSNMAALMRSSIQQFKAEWWQHPLLGSGFCHFLNQRITDKKNAKKNIEQQMHALQNQKIYISNVHKVVAQCLEAITSYQTYFAKTEKKADEATSSKERVREYIANEKKSIGLQIRRLEKACKALIRYEIYWEGRRGYRTKKHLDLAKERHIESQISLLEDIKAYIPQTPPLKSAKPYYPQDDNGRNPAARNEQYQARRKLLLSSYGHDYPDLQNLPEALYNEAAIRRARAICMAFEQRISSAYFAAHLRFRNDLIAYYRRALLHPLSHFMAMLSGHVLVGAEEAKRLWHIFSFCTPVICIPLDAFPNFLFYAPASTFQTAIFDQKEDVIPYQLDSLLYCCNSAIIMTSGK